MAENIIALQSVSEILGENFFIPSYQRGFRWTRQQVKELLDDVYSFVDPKKDNKEQEFYCLQPIILKKCDGETKEKNKLESELDWYEVADGQQRLTTIRILVKYLVEKISDEDPLKDYSLKYQTRDKTEEFLNSLPNPPKHLKPNKYIDFYFIYEAYNCISEWFDSKKDRVKDVRKTMLKTLVHDKRVQFIRYEINDDTNPIEVFVRINMGRIPLTNAELIKALFLQKKNFNEAAELRQIEIAKEWDGIEYSLQNDNFWWFLNKAENNAPARIEFLFNLMFEVEKKDNEKSFEEKYGSDNYSTFRFFYEKFSKSYESETVKNEWNKVKKYFHAFEDWFEHPVWYHYIGFLIYCGKKVVYIYELYENKKKDEFEASLTLEIKKEMSKISCEKIKGTKPTTYHIDLPYETKNKKRIRRLHLLLNLQFIVKRYEESQKENQSEIFIKFPFKLFKEKNWDIEHIDSFTTNPLKGKDAQNEWLNMAKEDLGNKISETLKERILVFQNRKDSSKEEFDKLQADIIKMADEEDNNEDTKNSIGNLTLLDAGTNRSYGNALFPTKRRIIIEKDKNGQFIPECTKHVFLKYFDEKDTSRTQWTSEDIKQHRNFIGKYLEKFLPFKK